MVIPVMWKSCKIVIDSHRQQKTYTALRLKSAYSATANGYGKSERKANTWVEMRRMHRPSYESIEERNGQRQAFQKTSPTNATIWQDYGTPVGNITRMGRFLAADMLQAQP